jgi:Tfp pilus assembly protein PilF
MTAGTNVSRRAMAMSCAILAVAVYLNSLANGFALDDVFIIQLNARVHDAGDLRAIWLSPYWPSLGQELGLYRPATTFMFAVQWAAGGGAAWVFHAVSIAAHAGVTVMVFLLLERLAGRGGALAGALVFAVHPVHTEAVANLVGQAEILGAAAVVGACLVHSGRTGDAVSWPRRLLLVLLYALALTSKESTVVLPGLLVLVDFAQRRVALSVRRVAAWADEMLMPLALLGVTLAAYLLLRFDVMGGAVMGMDAAPAMPYLREEFRVLNALRAFPELLRLLILPLDLSSDYLPGVLLPVEDVRPMVLLGAALLLSLCVLAVLTPWQPAFGFPAAWFLISVVTVSNLFFPIGVLVAERTLYLPSVALSALVAFAWRATATLDPARMRARTAALAIIVLLFGVRTWIRNPDWKDTSAVLGALVRDQPHSYRAQWVQANRYRERGEMDLAAERFDLAMRIYDRDSHFLTERGDFLLRVGRIDEAIHSLERAHSIDDSIPSTLLVLATAYLAAERYADALDIVRQAERLDVDRATVMTIRAAAHDGLEDYVMAIAAWRIAARNVRRPSWRIHAFLARSLAAGGYERQAAEAVAAARESAPDSTTAHTIRRLEEAISAGCYAPEPDTRRAVATCDPLGAWAGAVRLSARSESAEGPDL